MRILTILNVLSLNLYIYNKKIFTVTHVLYKKLNKIRTRRDKKYVQQKLLSKQKERVKEKGFKYFKQCQISSNHL